MPLAGLDPPPAICASCRNRCDTWRPRSDVILCPRRRLPQAAANPASMCRWKLLCQRCRGPCRRMACSELRFAAPCGRCTGDSCAAARSRRAPLALQSRRLLKSHPPLSRTWPWRPTRDEHFRCAPTTLRAGTRTARSDASVYGCAPCAKTQSERRREMRRRGM
jgi:hypothetical protein